MNYYVALQSKSHAFLLEQRMKQQGIQCELTYMPRDIMTDLCNMGVKFNESVLNSATQVIRHSGLPGCRIYMEKATPGDSQYVEIQY